MYLHHVLMLWPSALPPLTKRKSLPGMAACEIRRAKQTGCTTFSPSSAIHPLNAGLPNLQRKKGQLLLLGIEIENLGVIRDVVFCSAINARAHLGGSQSLLCKWTETRVHPIPALCNCAVPVCTVHLVERDWVCIMLCLRRRYFKEIAALSLNGGGRREGQREGGREGTPRTLFLLRLRVAVSR